MRNQTKIKYLVALTTIILFITACKKDHSVLDAATQPANDGLNTEQIADITVTAHTILADTNASFFDRYRFLGSNNDPVFGKTDVGIYANTSLNLSNLNLTTATLTSSEIILAVDPIYFTGDPAAKLTCSVFPVNQTLDPDAIYYSGNDRMHSTTPICVSLASYTVAANGQAVLHIDIDKTYAAQLMADTANLKTNDTYQAKYKGYYIAASSANGGEGIIYKADLEDNLSGFYLYYKDGSQSSTDSIFQVRFPFSGANTTKYNTVKFSPSQDIQNQVQDSSLGANRLFLKGFGNTKLKLEIPFLRNMSDSFSISVNRAELIFYEDPSVVAGTSKYAEAPQLTLLAMDSLSKERFIEDHKNATAFARYDGTYDVDNRRYVFNISREVQAILAGKKKNRGYYLVVAKSSVGLNELYATSYSRELLPLRRDNYAERVVLAGSGNFSLKPRLNLSFVKLRNEVK